MSTTVDLENDTVGNEEKQQLSSQMTMFQEQDSMSTTMKNDYHQITKRVRCRLLSQLKLLDVIVMAVITIHFKRDPYNILCEGFSFSKIIWIYLFFISIILFFEGEKKRRNGLYLT